MWLTAVAVVTLPPGLMLRLTAVTTRPNEAALVTSLSSIVQMYGWCEWALMITFTRSSRPFAMLVISGPLKFAQRFTSA